LWPRAAAGVSPSSSRHVCHVMRCADPDIGVITSALALVADDQPQVLTERFGWGRTAECTGRTHAQPVRVNHAELSTELAHHGVASHRLATPRVGPRSGTCGPLWTGDTPPRAAEPVTRSYTAGIRTISYSGNPWAALPCVSETGQERHADRAKARRPFGRRSNFQSELTRSGLPPQQVTACIHSTSHSQTVASGDASVGSFSRYRGRALPST
jgi:hypothetical protein